MAQEFAEADLSPTFRSNGTARPAERRRTTRCVAERLRRLPAGRRRAGRERRAASRWPSCARCRRARRSRATIASKAGARSASGKARGCRRCSTRSSRSRRRATSCSTAPIRWKTTARARTTRASTWTTRCTSQTILAYELNDQPLPVPNGAPIRLRVERQLGYKHAKYVMRLELVESFAKIARRQGRLLGGPGLPVVRGNLSR